MKKATVFEDEDSIRTMVGQLLEEHGYAVQTYDSPIRAERSSEPDLIVSDIRMPEMTGIEYVRQLRSNGCRVRHIALMSGDWHIKDLREAEFLGCKVFHKPFPMRDLSAWVQSLPA